MFKTAILGAAAAALVGGMAGQASAQPMQDHHFLEHAVRGDNSEIALGGLAARRGLSPRTREFGRILRRDHMHARAQAVRVASRMGWRAPAGMLPEARREMRRLEHLRGHAFDREFARYMVDDHRKDVRDFRQEARQGGPIGRLARNTLPDLRKHLGIAEALDRG